MLASLPSRTRRPARLARWARSHRVALAAAVSALTTMGCATSASGIGLSGAGTGTGPFHPRIDALPPPTRVVPLRLVQPVQCEGCTDCAKSCQSGPPTQDVVESVQRANETFAASGVSFAFQGIERVEAPSWWKHGARNVRRTWEEIREDARRVFPWMPGDAWKDPSETKATDIWLEVLVAVYGRPHELTVFVQWGGNGNRGETHFPNGGRGMWVMDGLFGHGPGRGRHDKLDSLYLFAHELGHYFGLRHTFAHAGTNPVDNQPWRLADRWDLVYRPGSGPNDPHRFFNSREEAAAFPERELRLIEEMDDNQSNCREERDGAIECVLPGAGDYRETHRSGSPALRGHSFPLGPEGGRYRWARNAMSYGDMEIPRRLSVSQIDIVRKFLQYPLLVGQKAISRWGKLPDGVRGIPCYRSMLGLSPSG